MILYICTIVISMILVAAVNIIVSPFTTQLSPLYCIIAVIIETVAVIALDGLEAWLLRRLPEKWFSAENTFFNVSDKECKIYRNLGVRKWKNKVPELGGFTDFSKSKVAKPSDNAYLERFVLEGNYGAVIHLVNAVTGFLIILIYPLKYALCFGVPLAFVNFILSLMPMMILRYNQPKLKTLIRRNNRLG